MYLQAMTLSADWAQNASQATLQHCGRSAQTSVSSSDTALQPGVLCAVQQS